ncbi:MAG: hydroxysqualene dehydroxylase HpnE [Acidimicrobiales bacterium]
MRVAVLGGGLAGITAALASADGGAEVVLLERRARLGGLTWSFRRRGVSFDNGQHVFLRCCTAYLGFLDRIGARDQVAIQRRLDVPVLAPGGRRAHISRDGLPAPLHLAHSLLAYRHLSLGDRARLGRAVLGLRSLDLGDPALDDETFGAWLARHSQRASAVERLWDLVTLPTVNVPAAEASLALAARVFRTGLLDTNDGADIGWSLVPLTELHGDHGARALDAAGVEVALGTAVEAVDPTDDGFEVTAGEQRLAVDKVVCALPPDAAAALLPEASLPAVDGLGTSPIVNVHLVLDRRVTDLPLAAAVDSPVQFVFDHTAASGMTPRGQCLTISLSAADRYVGQRPEALIADFHRALGELLPAARGARLVDGVVSREHTATFRGTPGTAALRPSAATAVPGLFVAGAWCATGWPATMEGAVRSGITAAAALVGTGVSAMQVPGTRVHDAATAMTPGSPPASDLQEAPA